MAPLADQPGEIGFCDFTKAKRVEITLRGACGGVPKSWARCGGTMSG